MKRVFTDRSRILQYQRCPRRRWHEYHEGGMGLAPRRTPLPLAVGGAVHEGLAVLLRRGQERIDKYGALAFDTNDNEWKQIMEDDAVEAALAEFRKHIEGLELDLAERTELERTQPSLEDQLNASIDIAKKNAPKK